MAITHVHSYLVHHGKNILEKDRSAICGTTLQLSGKLFEMLANVYQKATQECTTAISFTSSDQKNEARELVVNYATRPHQQKGLKLAHRLQGVTDGTSGMGLLFLVRGDEGGRIRTVISRFPADVGILAEEDETGLNVEYLEKVFMKNSRKYKAALYEDAALNSGYWSGHVVDHQLNSDMIRTASDYWVIEFLLSNCLTTPKVGSTRLAKMIKEAVKGATSPAVKSELGSLARLLPNLSGKKVSPRSIAKKYALSVEATMVLKERAKTDQLFNEEFLFDKASFSEVLSFKSVELTSGAILSAPSTEFENVFEEEVVDAKTGEVLFTTQGVIADMRFKRGRP